MGDSEHSSRRPGGIVSAPPSGHPSGRLVDRQRLAAVSVLRNCSTATGIRGSARAYGHRQLWSRDSMISLLGASLIEDPVVQPSLHASVEILERNKSRTGCVANNIDLATGKPNFRAYADGGLWYVIGRSILRPDLREMRRVLRWYEFQDVDGSDLISIQEASDWEDCFCVRGKSLYVNCLHVIALRRTSALAATLGDVRQAARYRRRAEAAQAAINRRLWYAGDGAVFHHIGDSFSTENLAADSLGRRRWYPPKRILRDAEYYLPYVSFREIGEWFDTLGNLLAILSGVADERQAARILDFIDSHGLSTHPIRSIYPPVMPGEPDWRDYYGSLNLPHQYHNGGIWPFIGGFYVAALVKAARLADAERALVRLAELNQESEFCEWLHGETLEPAGVREQAWSAGMFLFATECVAARTVPFF